MTDDLLIWRKQEQRRKLLRCLYGLSNGKEGFTIAPMNHVAIGSQVGLSKEEVLEAVRFSVSEGLLEYKPASEAVSLTHKGVVAVEDNSAQMAAERNKKLKALPDKIVAVLESAADTLQLMQLRAALQEYKELPDKDWFEALKNLRAKGIVSFETTANSAGQPVNTAYHFGIANRSRINLSDATKINVVTLGGEVFEIAYQRKEGADKRDGVLYLFTIIDRKKGRGMRHVMLFRGGAKDYYAQDYDARIDVVRLNAIRRSFDLNLISFDMAFENDKYLELTLKQSDFRSPSPTDEKQLSQFIKRTAYWLGYKLSSNADRYFVRFDNEQDLEYLGVSLDDVRRNVWRLRKEGYLESSEIPGNGLATLKLIEEMESLETEKPKSTEGLRSMANSRDVFLVHGHDQGMQQTVARFLEKLKLKAVILSEQASKGRTIIQKFEDHSSVPFAVVLLSPDDYGAANGKKGLPRARQNVILELGYFIGKLGRKNVCALHKGGVELPSDLHGVIWVPYEGDWKLTLAKEVKAAGIEIDLNEAVS